MNYQRIQLTATTPSSSAVRLETGAVEFELSNRVQNVPAAAAAPHDLRLFARAQVLHADHAPHPPTDIRQYFKSKETFF